MKVDDTPFDIWSVVTAYLPKHDVENLCGVSKQFRLFGLETRFKNLRFHSHDKAMKKLCEILCTRHSQDEIAPVVRKLTIESWFVEPRTEGYASLSEGLWNRVNTVFNPKHMELELQKRVRKRINKDIQRVTGAIRGLNSVREYQILHDERQRYHRELLEAFLSPTLAIISANLVHLTIKVPFDLLWQLSYVRLPQLQSLDICLCTGEARMEDVRNALDGCFVFIHNLRGLEHFGISATCCSRHLDLSYFSKRWGTFPGLRSFSLSIPFNGGLLTFPEEFYYHVIQPHARTLEKLKLNGTCCGPSPGRLPPGCQFWVQRILKASFLTTFPRLRDIQLTLRPLKGEHRAIDLHGFLRLRASALEKLCLTDRVLNAPELAELFNSLCPRDAFPTGRNNVLESLNIKVDVLSAGMIVLIAQRFPQLKSLSLDFSDITSTEMHPWAKVPIFQSILFQYKSTVFANWTLRDLKLVEGPPTYRWFWDLERTFRRNLSPPLNIGELQSPTS